MAKKYEYGFVRVHTGVDKFYVKIPTGDPEYQIVIAENAKMGWRYVDSILVQTQASYNGREFAIHDLVFEREIE